MLKSASDPSAAGAVCSGGAGGVSAVPPALQRVAMLAGAEALEKLRRTKALIFGVGGVGSWCAEALARSGVGKIAIVDFDAVCASNINRQLQATGRTLGRAKVEALKERLLEISPGCEIDAWAKPFSREAAGEFGIETADYVIDAIDSLTHKLDLIEICSAAGAKFFSSMGMARKMDPTRLKAADIWETRGCPLARAVRQGLRRRGFRGKLTVVYGEECLANIPIDIGSDAAIGAGSSGAGLSANGIDGNGAAAAGCDFSANGIDSNGAADADGAGSKARFDKKMPNGSVVTVTAAAGMILASLVLRDACRGSGG